MKTPFPKKYILHLIPIVLLGAYLSWHMLGVTKYQQLPWWKGLASDFECGAMTSALGLANDGQPVDHVLYPAVTLYNMDAALLRAAAAVMPKYRSLLHLKGFANIKEAFARMNEAVHLTRLGVLLTTIPFAAVLYIFFFVFLRSRLFAFFWAFFLMTEAHVIYYNGVLRPELISLCSFFCLALLSLSYFRCSREESPLRRHVFYFVAIGALMGYAVFSKVQIFPALLAYFALMFYYLFRASASSGIPTVTADRKNAVFNLGTAVLNMALFPWWAVSKPAQITPELLKYWPWYDLYGPPPGKASFVAVPLIAFLVLLSISLGLFELIRTGKGASLTKRIFPVVFFVNLLVPGLILSVYTTGLGGFGSWSSYLVNTHTFVYATFCNFYFAGQMNYKLLNWGNFQRIYAQFIHVPFFVFSFFYVLIVGWLWAFVRAVWNRTQNRWLYVYSVLAFGIGFGFDLLATLRAKIYMFNYGVYSVCFYVLGLVLLTAGELKYVEGLKSRNIRRGILTVFAVVFLGHMAVVTSGFIKQYKDRDPNKGDYKLQFRHCVWQSKFFWNMIEADLYRSADFKAARAAGRTLKWGKNNNQIMAAIRATDQTPQLLTPQDKTGKLDELIVTYTRQLKYKAYVYNYLLAVSAQLAARDNPNAALANYGKAITVLPDVPDAYQKRARLYYRMQAYAKGMADVRTARRLGAKIDPVFEQRLRLTAEQK